MNDLDTDLDQLWGKLMLEVEELHQKHSEEDFYHWLGLWFGPFVVDGYKEWLDD